MSRIAFTLYTGDHEDSLRPRSLRELLLDRDLPILARAENSGSEACYVELAAWDWKAGQWCRFGFEKFFGGELWRGLDCFQTCERLAALINKRKHTELQRFIPCLPSYPHRAAKGNAAEIVSA